MASSDEPVPARRGATWPPARHWAALRAHFADPLFRNAYALMMNTATTGLLGLLYWLLVARLYRPTDVGRASAAYAAMNLLAGVTAVSFTGVLTRFIPQSGHRTRHLVIRAYAISAGSSVVLTVLFLLAVGRLGSSYAELGTLTAGVVFTVCVATWAIFTLQDSVLTGLRGATWVLAENGTFGIVKIGLLVALAGILPHLGIYVSWMLPVFVAVPLINSLIFGNLVPRHTRMTADVRPPTGRQIGRFLAGDYTGALALLATGNLVPVLVASRLQPTETAYFYMAWAVGGILELLSVNMATSLTVEGAFDASTIAANARAALRRMAMIIVPGGLLAALLARWALGLFGAGYAARGAPVLELLALGSLPQAAIELYLGVLRAESRASRVALIQGVRAVLILALTGALMIPMGTIGAGLAFLVSQVAIVVLIAPGLIRALTGGRGWRGRVPAWVPAPQAGPEPASRPGPRWPLRYLPGPDAAPLAVPMQTGRTDVQDALVTRPMAAVTGAAAPADTGTRPMQAQLGRLAGSWRGRLPGTWRSRLPVTPTTLAVGALASTGFVAFFAFLHGVDLRQMTGIGLFSVLPAGSLAGVVLLALALIAGITLPRAHPVLLGFALAGLMVCLDGVTVAVEAQPRFPTSYWIAGFVDFIAKNGHSAPGLDAYLSWPGFFAFVAFLEGATGQHSILTVLRLWPVTIDLLCLLPLFLIMRNLRVNWRARWLAGFLFAVGNWVGQDYFSPQAFGYLLYLIFVAILVNWFTRTSPAARPGGDVRAPSGWSGWLASRPWPRWLPWPDWLHWPAALRPGRLHRRVFGKLEPGELPSRAASTGQLAFLLTLLLGIYAAAVTSHQLSPFYMLGACAVLVLARRCTLPGLPVLLGVMVAGWVSFAAVAFWSGHMADLFGNLGQIGGNISVSVGGRMTGSTSVHKLALETRLLIAAVIVGAACLGIIRRRLRHLSDRVLTVLMFMPITTIALQSYGGEMALRIYLFLLPFAAILAALFFFPGPQAEPLSWRWLPPIVASAMVLPLAFFVARYGNENFERTPTGELTAMNYIYGHAPHGAQVLWPSEAPAVDVTPQMPWSYQDIAKVSFSPVKAPPDPASTGPLASLLHRDGPGTYLIIPQTQVSYLEETASYQRHWGQRFRAAMAAAPGIRVAYADATATVYTASFPPGTPVRAPAVNESGPPVASSIWTPLGLALLWLLIVMLAVREFIRVCNPLAGRLLRTLTLVSWPLVVVMAGIVIIRFMVL